MTVTQAAKAAHCTIQHIRLCIRKGMIEATRHGLRVWIVDDKSVARWIETRKKPGRPKK